MKVGIVGDCVFDVTDRFDELWDVIYGLRAEELQLIVEDSASKDIKKLVELFASIQWLPVGEGFVT